MIDDTEWPDTLLMQELTMLMLMMSDSQPALTIDNDRDAR